MAGANRVSFTSSEGTGTWEFVYDTTAGIPAVIEEVTPSGSVYYIREPNGALIARVVGSVLDATTTRYYHFDALGSTRKLTDKDGVVTDTYSYDAWGNATHVSGTTEQPYQYVGQLGYYSHYQDENLDLLQLGVRFYDPETGRFTQRDPVKDGLNWYAYVGDTPLTMADPRGLSTSDQIWNPGFDGGWDTIDKAIMQSACADVLKNPKTSFEMLRRFVRCIIWGESLPKDDMRTRGVPIGGGPCKGHRAIGLMQIVGCYNDTKCRSLGYDKWATDAAHNIGCGVAMLCDCLKRNCGDIGKCKWLYNSIGGREYSTCMNELM